MVWRSELWFSFCVPFFGPHNLLHGKPVLLTCSNIVQAYRDRTSSVSGGSSGDFGDGLRPLNHSNRALSKAHGSPDTLILQLLWGPNLLTYPGEAHGGGRKLIPAAWLCPGSIWGPFRNEGFLVHPCVWVTLSRGVSGGGRAGSSGRRGTRYQWLFQTYSHILPKQVSGSCLEE